MLKMDVVRSVKKYKNKVIKEDPLLEEAAKIMYRVQDSANAGHRSYGSHEDLSMQINHNTAASIRWKLTREYPESHSDYSKSGCLSRTCCNARSIREWHS